MLACSSALTFRGAGHLGYWQRRFLPTSRGFQSWLGYLSGAEDHFTQKTGDACVGVRNGTHLSGTDLWYDRGDGSQPLGGTNAFGINGTYSAYLYTNHAVSVIEQHGKKVPPAPLFLYAALHNIHGPDQVSDQFLERYSEGIYPARRTIDAMVSATDSTLANISSALHSAGMADDTLTILVSDNGGPIQEPGGSPSPGSNYPSRGGKYSFFEGGIKVVGIVHHPKLLASRAGAIWDGLVSVADWYAVLCGLAGADADDTGPGRVPIDAVDVWQSLLTGAVSPRVELIIGIGEGRGEPNRPVDGSLRVDDPAMGKMKLIVGRQRAGTAWVGPSYPNASTPTSVFPPPVSCDPACLFNISSDPREEHDLAQEMPALRAKLRARWVELASELSAPNQDSAEDPGSMSKQTDDRACEAMLAAGGWWRPWASDGEASPSGRLP